MTTAYLEYSVNVDCPKCEESNDITDSEHDTECEVPKALFNNKWDDLKGFDVTCEHCGHEFKIEEVEY